MCVRDDAPAVNFSAAGWKVVRASYVCYLTCAAVMRMRQVQARARAGAHHAQARGSLRELCVRLSAGRVSVLVSLP
jgi:hypothetical protein